jgi:hypothetical protein
MFDLLRKVVVVVVVVVLVVVVAVVVVVVVVLVPLSFTFFLNVFFFTFFLHVFPSWIRTPGSPTFPLMTSWAIDPTPFFSFLPFLPFLSFLTFFLPPPPLFSFLVSYS